MEVLLATRPARRRRRFTFGIVLALTALAAPAGANAAVMTFGSPLAVPATLNTSDNLAYAGFDVPVPPTPEYPNGLVHTTHFGADAALWNVNVAAGSAASPSTGQAVEVRVEGCAERAPGGPAPLREIHLQDISPLPGGGARVNLSSQPFPLPVCGENGASGSTVTAYRPVNLCVAAGDYVALNDEGGFVPYFYKSGVPYRVIGARQGSVLDSFIRNNGVGNGAVMSSSDSGPSDGFASNVNEEVMLQVTLATGPDATHVCPGGSAGAPPVLSPISVRPQTDGVNRSRATSVAIYCRPAAGCRGVATLTAIGKSARARAKRASVIGSASFNLRGNKTGHVPIRVSSQLVGLLRKQRGGVPVTLTAAAAGATVSQTIVLRIF